MKLLTRWTISVISLVVTAWLVPGIRVEGNAWKVFAVMAVILGLVNAVVRPLLQLFTLPLILLSLGLFLIVINGFSLWLASAIAVDWFHVGFHVDGFWAALLGAFIVSITSVILSAFIREEK
ncbi:MAG: phage holin family protein [Thermodesulfovibrionales bacterium]|jgi:putative membrane protein